MSPVRRNDEHETENSVTGDNVCSKCRAAWNPELRACLHCDGTEKRPRGFIEMTADYGIPATGASLDAWVECALAITADELAKGDDHFTSHAVFAHKGLGEDWTNALVIAASFRDHALTRDDCYRLAADWWEPTKVPA